MADPIVELRDVTFGYAATPVVENITMHLHAGQFAGLLGPSGAGKSTLLKLILGILTPSRGSVFIQGENLDGKPSRRVAYVPQLETIDWNFPVTVEQLVLMGRIRRLGPLPWPSREHQHAVHEMLERLGIADMAQRHIRDLSGGQQQRAFLARALIAEPDLLVLDEPTSGVDVRTQENILHLLADLNKSGVTILMTTHDLNAAGSHLPWVFCINRRMVACGSPDEVFTSEILNETYRADIEIFRHNGTWFIAERRHGHTVQEVIPNPVPGEPMPRSTRKSQYE